MAYPICYKYPSHPPADGSSTAKGSARHWFGFNVTVCALLLFTWSLVRSPAVTAYCYNPRIAGIGDKSNALITTLSLTLSETWRIQCTYHNTIADTFGDVMNPVHLSQHYHWHLTEMLQFVCTSRRITSSSYAHHGTSRHITSCTWTERSPSSFHGSTW
jgi:hypothetical protein